MRRRQRRQPRRGTACGCGGTGSSDRGCNLSEVDGLGHDQTKRQPTQPTAEQFHYSFGNLLSEKESKAVYDRYAVPGPDHLLFQASLANFNPHAATAVNFHNDTRAALLLIAGGKDHIVPASVTKANYKLYRKSKAVTDFKEYPDRSHYTVGQPGWEEVTDYALSWAVENAASYAQKAQPAKAALR